MSSIETAYDIYIYALLLLFLCKFKLLNHKIYRNKIMILNKINQQFIPEGFEDTHEHKYKTNLREY